VRNSHSSEYEGRDFVECDALKSGRYLPTFLGNLLPPFSGIPKYIKVTMLA